MYTPCIKTFTSTEVLLTVMSNTSQYQATETHQQKLPSRHSTLDTHRKLVNFISIENT